MRRLEAERIMFKKASTTYYWSSRFFPSSVRADVFRLYSFARYVDDLVDSRPQQRAAFAALRAAWRSARRDPAYTTAVTPSDSVRTRTVKNMLYLQRKYRFEPAWIDAFLDAMQSDIAAEPCHTIEDTLQYMHGSAEVIGLMMARILGLPKEADETARLQGRAMQFINFLRDIAEDNDLGRQYIPLEDLERFSLPDLSRETVLANQAAFTKLMRFELARYRKWQAEAAAGYAYIPLRLRIPIKTAADMYSWTAKQIGHDPLVVFIRKVKPSKRRVVGRVLANAIR